MKIDKKILIDRGGPNTYSFPALIGKAGNRLFRTGLY